MKFTFSSFLGFIISLIFLLTGSADTVGVIKISDGLPEFLKIPFLDFPSFFVVVGGMLSGLFVTGPAVPLDRFLLIGDLKPLLVN